MTPYFIDWALIFCYTKKEHRVHLVFSNAFSQTNCLGLEQVVIENKDIRDIVHKYDYRKLEYFTDESSKQIFDTSIRLNLPQLGRILRTKAVCSRDEKGFRCINFEEVKLLKLRKSMKKSTEDEPVVEIRIKNMRELSADNKRLARVLEEQLALFFKRETKNKHN